MLKYIKSNSTIEYFKSKLKGDLLKISFGVSVTTVYKMIIVIVITKWISIHLGPSGIAMTSIFGNFVTLSQTVATGGISTGIIKLISEYITNKQKLKEYSIIFRAQSAKH